MANIIVTSTATTVSVDFGVYETVIGTKKGTWQRDSITAIELGVSEHSIEVHTKGDHDWKVCYSAYADSLIIDSVDGVAPSSNADLYTKLVALII